MSAPWKPGEAKRIVIVGLGLIGGSLAKALTQNTPHQVLGMDIDDDSLLDACSCGTIRGKAGPEDLKDADLIYLCVYPEAALDFVRQWGPKLKEGCILTDA
ncbi:MAG TPA: prephenate dehydrogenase/arogenate dehydrogenase family protein, partial [Candidatus Acutalibacter ornithocaccae]|nr:prephenate dehydrogenase/arogenate dehydrogenase family protein [Candidatus Acutalibacter ornithocaccae]